MKIAAFSTIATVGARLGGRARSLLLLALMGASLPAWSEPPPDDRQQRQDAQRERQAPREPQRVERAPQADPFRRDGRLTPDERGDLRRQIKEAGKEIYQQQPQRR